MNITDPTPLTEIGHLADGDALSPQEIAAHAEQLAPLTYVATFNDGTPGDARVLADVQFGPAELNGRTPEQAWETITGRHRPELTASINDEWWEVEDGVLTVSLRLWLDQAPGASMPELIAHLRALAEQLRQELAQTP